MRRRVLVALGVFSIISLGCSRPESAADRHAADMREQIDKIQEDQDKAAMKLADEGTAPAKGSQAAKAPPPNRSMQIGEGETESEDPNDPSARPQISLAGPPGAAGRSRSTRSGSARIESSDSNNDPNRKEPSVLDPDARKAYEAALKQIHEKQYAKGVEALNAFMVKWPDHPYIENATYWKGEAFFAQGEYQKAIEQFEAVVSRFNIGTKAPDALLKVGMCHEKLGATSKAHEAWDRLKRDYPKSEAVRKIPASDEKKSRGPKETR